MAAEECCDDRNYCNKKFEDENSSEAERKQKIYLNCYFFAIPTITANS